MKDVGLRVCVERPLRDAFLETCREQDMPAAQVIRQFMRSYMDQYMPGKGAHPLSNVLDDPRKKRSG